MKIKEHTKHNRVNIDDEPGEHSSVSRKVTETHNTQGSINLTLKHEVLVHCGIQKN